MGAGLERHVERGAPRVLSGGLERHDLGVRPAGPLVPALPHDVAVADEHRADDGVRRRPAPAALRQLERAGEVLGVRHSPASSRTSWR